MRSIKIIYILFMSLGLTAGVIADEAGEVSQCAQGKVDAVLPGDILRLDSGEKVQLMMVQTPRMPQGSETGKPWPMAEQILAKMTLLLKSKTISFFCLPQMKNRRGELIAMARMPDGEWLQSLMIDRGWARVYSQPGLSYEAEMFYSHEDHSREDGLGLWAYESYAIRRDDSLNEKVGRFEIVEGRVLDIAQVKNITYMNFGQDWRKDFTVKLSAKNRKLFKKMAIDPENYTGKRIQVRGWVSWNGGPMIDLTHPHQMRVLED